jgi:molybdopterin synthase sulfur carrier subunit
MTIRMRLLPSRLREAAGGAEFVNVEGANVGECLDSLVMTFPRVSKEIFDQDGKLKVHLEIFINGITTFPEELNATVKDGDELSILALVVGG